MHKKINNSLTRNFIQGLRPLSNTLPSQVKKILKKNGFNKAPQNFIPTKLINSLAPFNKEMKSMANMVNRGSYDVDISETISLFGSEPTSLEKTLIDMSKSLQEIERERGSV